MNMMNRTPTSHLVRCRLRRCAALLVLGALPMALQAVPDASGNVTSTPAPDISADAAMSARLNYNIGYELIEKAQAAEKQAVGLQGAKAKAAQQQAMSGYVEARTKMELAVKADPNLKEGWNLVGYTSRRLGDYIHSLEAYEKALALDPKYPEAIEYRAEAYLALNRLEDAKTSYLALFAATPAQAAVLLDSMKAWVAANRTPPAGVSAADLSAFAAWVEERSGVAQKTASLRPGLAAPVRNWR
jgi:tetratricopeptide (TPR) repeat protein